MTKSILAPWPCFDEEIIKAVEEVLASGRVNQWTGSQVYSFEKEYAQYLGADRAIAMSNGSVTLDVALRVLGIGPGDEVVVSCRSFVASASCVAMAGALPMFADIDPDSGNITAETIRPVITKKTKAVIVVHLAGWPCDMDPILELCHGRKIAVIEDCAQANGARYKGRHVGTMGDFGSFSFCQDKIFTTGGEGGMLVTNNRQLWQKAWSLKDHGRDFEAVFNRNTGPSFKWMVNSFGTNYRMTEMQAAIGRVMLKRLDEMVACRRHHADILSAGLANLAGLKATCPPPDFYHSYYKYYVRLDPRCLKAGWSRDRALEELVSLGIVCGCGACPEIYREKAFQEQRKELGLPPQERLPAAMRLGEECIMFQVHPTLSPESLEYTVDSLRGILKKALL